jgi:hypothetical protein
MENTRCWQEVVPVFRRLSNSCVAETEREMSFRRSSEEFELEDELLAYVNEVSPYMVQTKYIMDEPIIKWDSLACQFHS